MKNIVNARSNMGKETEISGFIAVCDAAHYAGVGVPCIVYGCAGDGFHAKDEHVEIESLVETTKVIADSIVSWCGISEK